MTTAATAATAVTAVTGTVADLTVADLHELAAIIDAAHRHS